MRGPLAEAHQNILICYSPVCKHVVRRTGTKITVSDKEVADSFDLLDIFMKDALYTVCIKKRFVNDRQSHSVTLIK